MRRFEYRDEKTAKFWNIELAGRSFRCSFGKIGSTGQTRLKEFADDATALREHDRAIAEKLREGYVEVGTVPVGAPAGGSLREALEAALVANPADRTAHSAYADLLTEEGDPRGELIAVQLALEDEKLPPAERNRLRAREQDLLKAHQREWLGGLAPYLLEQRGWEKSYNVSSAVGYEFGFARGWLDCLHVAVLGEEFARLLASAPQARLLRALLIDHAGFDEESDLNGEELPVDDEERNLYRLAQSPHLGNLTLLRLGDEVEVDHNEQLCVRCWCRGYLPLVRRLPRLEELYLLFRTDDLAELFALPTLTHLRILQVYHCHAYPLKVLADNPAFANLTTLLCHPASYSGYAQCLKLADFEALCRSCNLPNLTHLRARLTEVGDEGCLAVVDSGILKRLKILDLNLGSITDEGARILADCPDLKHLDLLDLGRNALTEEGIAVLQATGVALRAHDQHVDDDDDEWCCIGDIE
jgi:uncharacterized protein (TIGR02996 family)